MNSTLSTIYAITLLIGAIVLFYKGKNAEGIGLLLLLHMLYIEEKIDNLNK